MTAQPAPERRGWGAVLRGFLADPERVARWVALVACTGCLAGFGVSLGLQVSPVLGWGAPALVALAATIALWRRRFEAQGEAAGVAEHLQAHPAERLQVPGGMPPGGPLHMPPSPRN